MQEDNYQEVTLNIWYYLPEEILKKVPPIYAGMPGWLGYAPEGEGKGFPFWFSFDQDQEYITSYTEPSGFKLFGNMPATEWEAWVEEFKAKATQLLGFKVGDIEAGEVGYDLEWLE